MWQERMWPGLSRASCVPPLPAAAVSCFTSTFTPVTWLWLALLTKYGCCGCLVVWPSSPADVLTRSIFYSRGSSPAVRSARVRAEARNEISFTFIISKIIGTKYKSWEVRKVVNVVKLQQKQWRWNSPVEFTLEFIQLKLKERTIENNIISLGLSISTTFRLFFQLQWRELLRHFRLKMYHGINDLQLNKYSTGL